MIKNLYTSTFLVSVLLVSGCKTTSNQKSRTYESTTSRRQNSSWVDNLRTLSEALEEQEVQAQRARSVPVAPRQPAQPQTYRTYQQETYTSRPAAAARPATPRPAPAAPRTDSRFSQPAQPQMPQAEDPAIAESRRRQRADIERRQLEEAMRNSLRTFAEEEARRNPAPAAAPQGPVPAPQPAPQPASQPAPAAWEPNTEDMRVAGIKLVELRRLKGDVAPSESEMIAYLTQHMGLPRDRVVIILREMGLAD